MNLKKIYYKYKNKAIRMGSIFLGCLLLVSFIVGKVQGDRSKLGDLQDISVSVIRDDSAQFRVLTNDTYGEEKMTDAFAELIDSAEKSVDMLMYSMENQAVHDALNRAADRGVAVQVMTDTSKEADFIRKHGAAAYDLQFSRDNMERSAMHHKMILVDGNQGGFGSGNLTELQEKFDPSMYTFFNSETIYNLLQQEFNLIWNGKNGTQKFYSNNYKPYINTVYDQKSYTEFWRSPGTKKVSVKQKILEVIEAAEASIDIVMWQWNDKEIAAAVYKKAADGVQVRILVDDAHRNNKYSAIPKLEAIAEKNEISTMKILDDTAQTAVVQKQFKDQVKPDFNPYIHQHTLIVDNKTVVTGSANWTYRGFFSNDELTIVSDNKDIVKPLIDSFDLHWERNRK